jgi:prophage regulatory protein
MEPNLETLIRVREVERRTGLRRTSLYGLMSRGMFPRAVRLGGRAVAWRLSEVEQWIAHRPVADLRLRPGAPEVMG